MYLILEGVDTCGKSTQIELLKNVYKNATFTQEPGGTKIGKHIRELILKEGVKSKKAELFLFLADRAEHYEEVIKNSKDVISDRGFISGISYALANHDNYDLDFLYMLNKFAINSINVDYVVLLETNKELIIDRLSKKDIDVIEDRGIDYLLKVQNYMKDILKRLSINHLIIDASKDRTTIHKEILKFIKN